MTTAPTPAVPPTSPPATIRTCDVANRRKLRFATLDDLMRDAMRLAEAERAGTLCRRGNWTLGQALGHLAGWMNYAFDGYPMNPPWFIKMIVRLMKNRILRDGMPAGRRIPRVPGGTHSTDVLPLDEGLDRLSRAVDRLRSTDPARPNPMFGKLTHQQWIELNLRHAELHLSFFDVSGG